MMPALVLEHRLLCQLRGPLLLLPPPLEEVAVTRREPGRKRAVWCTRYGPAMYGRVCRGRGGLAVSRWLCGGSLARVRWL